MNLDLKDIEIILKRCDIFNQIKGYNFHRFHMPGHKGFENIFAEPIKNIYPSFDITELDDINLLLPKGSIIKFIEKLKDFYNSDYCFFSLQGSTHLIFSALFSLLKPMDKIIIGRDSHISVFNAAFYRCLKVDYIYPEYDHDLGIYTYYNIDEIEKMLSCTDAKVIFLTSPSYFGIIQDIKRISELCRKLKKVLIIDEAHGAHLKFAKIETSFDLGADITIMSLHKTLPCPNQTALLLARKSIDIGTLNNTLTSLHTTSPSYMLLTYAEYGFEFAKEFGSSLLNELKQKVYEITNPILFATNLKYDNVDFSKILINHSYFGLGNEFIDKVIKKIYGIMPEIYDREKALYYLSMIDATKNIEILKNVVYDIIKNRKNKLKHSIPKMPSTEKRLEIFFNKSY